MLSGSKHCQRQKCGVWFGGDWEASCSDNRSPQLLSSDFLTMTIIQIQILSTGGLLGTFHTVCPPTFLGAVYILRQPKSGAPGPPSPLRQQWSAFGLPPLVSFCQHLHDAPFVHFFMQTCLYDKMESFHLSNLHVIWLCLTYMVKFKTIALSTNIFTKNFSALKGIVHIFFIFGHISYFEQ